MNFVIETEDVTASWSDATDKEIDLLLAYAALLLGDPDTIS